MVRWLLVDDAEEQECGAVPPSAQDWSSYRSKSCDSQLDLDNFKMADMDVFAAMGIAGFGKATAKNKLDPARFDKNKRNEVSIKYYVPRRYL